MSELELSDALVGRVVQPDEVEIEFERGQSVMPGLKTMELAEPWTCPESGWYAFRGGAFVKVGDW